MSIAQQIGRLGSLYVKDEPTYAEDVVFAATDAFRHLTFTTRKSLNRSNSLEKKGTPGLTNRFSRHIEAGYQLEAYLSPSGTIQVAPNGRLWLKNGLGAERVGTVSTTVASGGDVDGAVLADASGLAVGEFILIHIATGPSAGRYARVVTGIDSDDTVSWVPDLPVAPANGSTVKAGVTYSLANALPKSMAIGRYLPDRSWEVKGAVVEQLGLMFNGNDEVKLTSQGPAQTSDSPAQAKPGAFTAVGSPVTGITGYAYVNDAALKIVRADFNVANLTQLINDSFGLDRAEDFYRDGRRDITVSLEQRLTDDTTLYDLADGPTDFALLLQAGLTEGRIVAVYAPRCELNIPEIPDDDGGIRNQYTAVCKETLAGLDGVSEGGNDEIIVALL
jgi:hypothetical protein